MFFGWIYLNIEFISKKSCLIIKDNYNKKEKFYLR